MQGKPMVIHCLECPTKGDCICDNGAVCLCDGPDLCVVMR